MIVSFYRWVWEHTRAAGIVLAAAVLFACPVVSSGWVLDLVLQDRGWPEGVGYVVALVVVSLIVGHVFAKQRLDERRQLAARRAVREDDPAHLATIVGLRRAVEAAIKESLPAGSYAYGTITVSGANVDEIDVEVL